MSEAGDDGFDPEVYGVSTGMGFGVNPVDVDAQDTPQAHLHWQQQQQQLLQLQQQALAAPAAAALPHPQQVGLRVNDGDRSDQDGLSVPGSVPLSPDGGGVSIPGREDSEQQRHPAHAHSMQDTHNAARKLFAAAPTAQLGAVGSASGGPDGATMAVGSTAAVGSVSAAVAAAAGGVGASAIKRHGSRVVAKSLGPESSSVADAAALMGAASSANAGLGGGAGGGAGGGVGAGAGANQSGASYGGPRGLPAGHSPRFSPPAGGAGAIAGPGSGARRPSPGPGRVMPGAVGQQRGGPFSGGASLAGRGIAIPGAALSASDGMGMGMGGSMGGPARPLRVGSGPRDPSSLQGSMRRPSPPAPGAHSSDGQRTGSYVPSPAQGRPFIGPASAAAFGGGAGSPWRGTPDGGAGAGPGSMRMAQSYGARPAMFKGGPAGGAPGQSEGNGGGASEGGPRSTASYPLVGGGQTPSDAAGYDNTGQYADGTGDVATEQGQYMEGEEPGQAWYAPPVQPTAKTAVSAAPRAFFVTVLLSSLAVAVLTILPRLLDPDRTFPAILSRSLPFLLAILAQIYLAFRAVTTDSEQDLLSFIVTAFLLVLLVAFDYALGGGGRVGNIGHCGAALSSLPWAGDACLAAVIIETLSAALYLVSLPFVYRAIDWHWRFYLVVGADERLRRFYAAARRLSAALRLHAFIVIVLCPVCLFALTIDDVSLSAVPSAFGFELLWTYLCYQAAEREAADLTRLAAVLSLFFPGFQIFFFVYANSSQQHLSTTTSAHHWAEAAAFHIVILASKVFVLGFFVQSNRFFGTGLKQRLEERLQWATSSAALAPLAMFPLPLRSYLLHPYQSCCRADEDVGLLDDLSQMYYDDYGNAYAMDGTGPGTGTVDQQGMPQEGYGTGDAAYGPEGGYADAAGRYYGQPPPSVEREPGADWDDAEAGQYDYQQQYQEHYRKQMAANAAGHADADAAAAMAVAASPQPSGTALFSSPTAVAKQQAADAAADSDEGCDLCCFCFSEPRRSRPASAHHSGAAPSTPRHGGSRSGPAPRKRSCLDLVLSCDCIFGSRAQPRGAGYQGGDAVWPPTASKHRISRSTGGAASGNPEWVGATPGSRVPSGSQQQQQQQQLSRAASNSHSRTRRDPGSNAAGTYRPPQAVIPAFPSTASLQQQQQQSGGGLGHTTSEQGSHMGSDAASDAAGAGVSRGGLAGPAASSGLLALPQPGIQRTPGLAIGPSTSTGAAGAGRGALAATSLDDGSPFGEGTPSSYGGPGARPGYASSDESEPRMSYVNTAYAHGGAYASGQVFVPTLTKQKQQAQLAAQQQQLQQQQQLTAQQAAAGSVPVSSTAAQVPSSRAQGHLTSPVRPAASPAGGGGPGFARAAPTVIPPRSPAPGNRAAPGTAGSSGPATASGAVMGVRPPGSMAASGVVPMGAAGSGSLSGMSLTRISLVSGGRGATAGTIGHIGSLGPAQPRSPT